MPDYTQYTITELDEALSVVNKEKYPENYTRIIQEIKVREKECAAIYSQAISALQNGKDEAKAQNFFQELTQNYSGTQQANLAKQYLKVEASEPLEIIETGEFHTPLTLEFKGSATDYFRVWIVNLCLSLLTLGIFSAWAKVRKKRYVYSHLTLDGTPFQYLGQPIPILKGRIIAGVIFIIYFSSNNFFPSILPYVFAGGLVIAPWVFAQSLAFSARYTAYRNMNFQYNASYLEALKVISAWGILPALILGTVFDWWGNYWIAALVYIPPVLLFPLWLKEIKKLIVTKTSFGGKYGEFYATGGDFYSAYFLAGLIVFAFGLLTAASYFSFASLGAMHNFKYFAYLTTFTTYVGYLLAYAFTQARITNAVWNKLRLGPLHFHCTLQATKLSKIYLTNALGILCSAGLLIPWAVIRTFKYRIDNTKVHYTDELTHFTGRVSTEVHATGAELTEFFDMDLSI